MKRKILYSMVLILCYCSILNSYAQTTDAEKKIAVLMDNYRFAEAIDQADISLASDTANRALLLLKSKALTKLFQYKQSCDVLLKAYASDTSDIMLIAELANLYQKKGDNKNAFYYSEKACRLSPQNAYFRLQLAGLYFADADYLPCIETLKYLCNTSTINQYAARLTADCYYELKQNDSSEFWYQKNLSTTPFDTYATQKLANIYIRTSAYEKGLQLTETYLKQDTMLNPVMKLNAWFYHLSKDYKTAVSRFRRCLVVGDSSLFVYRKLGLSYYKQQVFDSAELFFRQAFVLDTTDSETCFYYGVSAARSFLADTGLLYLNKTLCLVMPSESFLTNIYVEMAEAYNNKGDYSNALAVLQKIHSMYPENKRLYFRIGYQYDYYLNNLNYALENYELFIKDEPENLTEKNVGTEISFEVYARNRIAEINQKKSQQK
ncbi:MAG: hypothetical protein WCQ95_06475 [Bacteroidota bacterium]